MGGLGHHGDYDDGFGVLALAAEDCLQLDCFTKPHSDSEQEPGKTET